MAATFISFIFYWRFLHICFLFLFSFKQGHAFQGRKIAESHHLQHYHTVEINSLFSSTSCKRHTNKVAENKYKAYLEVVHKHGPCSPLYQEQRNASSSFIQTLLQDQLRVEAIHSRRALSRTLDRGDAWVTDAATLPAQSGDLLDTGYYIVSVGLGTPKRDLFLGFDTGSAITWTQCQPCQLHCYPQAQPIFDPSKSSSYSEISCTETSCDLLKSEGGSIGCGVSSECLYGVIYVDESYTVGYFSTERLTLTSNDVFDNFYFGCGQNNTGLFFGRAAGLLGLNRASFSLISQTAHKYYQIFSYCLPSSPSLTGFLTFGPSSPSSSTIFTPLLTLPDPNSFLYGIGLTGISVEGQKLSILDVVFSGGAILDSGALITRLPTDAYSALRSAFTQLMSQYPVAPSPSPLFDTCYDLSSYTNVPLPTIGLLLDGGGEVDVPASGILYGDTSSQMCLAFAVNTYNDLSIIGTYQQKTLEIIHDIPGNRIGFTPGGCK